MYEVTSSSHKRVGYLIVVVLMSFISGLVGGIVGQKDYQEQIDLLNLSNVTEKIKERVTNEIEPSELLVEIAPSIAEIYRYGDQVSEKNSKKDTTTQAIDALTGGARLTGYALAVTSDGWLVAPTSTLDDSLTNLRVVDTTGVVYTPEKKIDDKGTGLSFIKTTARNMKPISVAKNILDDFPQSHFYIENKTTIAPLTITALGYPASLNNQPVQATDVLKKVYNFTTAFSVMGAPVVTKQKEIVGVTTVNGIIPFSYAQDVLTQVLRTGTITRAKLPLNYIDRAWWTSPLKDPRYKDVKNGAIIISDKKVILASAQGPILLANGDVILAVNQEKVDTARSLSEIIQQYKVKDTVTLTVMQGASQKNYSVILE